MYGVILGVHVIVCLGLILAVLLQSSKGTGLAGGSAFGGGAEATVFGGRGAATFLSKATTILGASFMVTSLVLTLIGIGGGDGPESIVAREAAQNAPVAAPATGAPLGGDGTGTPVAPSFPAPGAGSGAGEPASTDGGESAGGE
jgi:preprotein translocase subunit SecG